MTDNILYPREADLVAGDIEAFIDAIVKAYPEQEFLYYRLANKWGIRVQDDIVALGQFPFKIIVRRIVEHARSEDRLLDLLGLAWSDKPGNAKLKALADSWLTDPAGVLAKYQAAAPPPVVPGPPSPHHLERLVNNNSRLVNLHDWLAGLTQLSGALCRVCIPEVNGTGFLIGRRTVLTNYHVVEPAIDAGATGDQIFCEFDYGHAGAVPLRLPARAGAEWLGPKSPYSLSDTTGSGKPAPDELDFAIIRLAAEVDAARVPLALPYAPPVVSLNDYVVIGQHPGGGEAQLAVGQVVEYPGESLRYRYDVTTEGGSSGSPVLDFNLRLVGLHHAADPAGEPRYNQAIPIARIKRALEAAQLDLTQL